MAYAGRRLSIHIFPLFCRKNIGFSCKNFGFSCVYLPSEKNGQYAYLASYANDE